MIRYPWRYSAALAAMGLAVAACGEGPGGTDGHEGTASIRLMNTASGTAGLDLVVGGKLVAGGVQYEQASAAVTVPDGEQTLAVRRSGEQNVLTSKAVTLVSGGKYTLMVSGTASALVLTSTSVVDTGQAEPIGPTFGSSTSRPSSFRPIHPRPRHPSRSTYISLPPARR